jgi:hypothetical protein
MAIIMLSVMVVEAEMGTQDKEQRAQDKAAYWREMLAAQTESGVGIPQFCRGRGLSAPQFYWWRRRLADSASLSAGVHEMAAGPTFVELTSVPLGEGGAATASWELHLDLGAGMVLHLRRG